MMNPKKILIAPQCKHLIAELQRYRHPVIKERVQPQMYDHEFDPYFGELLRKYGRIHR